MTAYSHQSPCITESALIVYISRGLLSSLTEAKQVLDTIARFNGHLQHHVTISTFAVIDGKLNFLVVLLS